MGTTRRPAPVQERPAPGRPRRRRPAHLVLVEDDGDVGSVRARMTPGAAVVTCSGLLDPVDPVRWQSVLDPVLRVRPADVVLDLSMVRTHGMAWSVLAAMRRYLHRHGIRVWIAAAPRGVLAELAASGTLAFYRLSPTTQDALGAAERLAHLGSGLRRPPGLVRG